MHMDRGEIRVPVSTYVMERLAKFKAQSAKKCLFSFYFYVLLQNLIWCKALVTLVH